MVCLVGLSVRARLIAGPMCSEALVLAAVVIVACINEHPFAARADNERTDRLAHVDIMHFEGTIGCCGRGVHFCVIGGAIGWGHGRAASEKNNTQTEGKK